MISRMPWAWVLFHLLCTGALPSDSEGFSDLGRCSALMLLGLWYLPSGPLVTLMTMWAFLLFPPLHAYDASRADLKFMSDPPLTQSTFLSLDTGLSGPPPAGLQTCCEGSAPSRH